MKIKTIFVLPSFQSRILLVMSKEDDMKQLGFLIGFTLGMVCVALDWLFGFRDTRNQY